MELVNYRGVALHEEPLKSQFDQVRDDYIRVPNDDLLKGSGSELACLRQE